MTQLILSFYISDNIIHTKMICLVNCLFFLFFFSHVGMEFTAGGYITINVRGF